MAANGGIALHELLGWRRSGKRLTYGFDEDMVARSVVNMTQTKKNCKIQRFCALACRMTRTRRAPLPTSSTIPTPRNSIEHMSPPLQVGGGRTSWRGFPPERHGPGPRHWREWTEAPQRGLLNRLSHHTPAITDRVQPRRLAPLSHATAHPVHLSVLNEVYGAPPSPWTHACDWWAARE